MIVSRVDVLLDKRSRKNDPSQSVFVTGVYESLVDKDKYQEFTDDYIDPNMGNQYSSGIMTRYTMYLEREATGGVAKPKAAAGRRLPGVAAHRWHQEGTASRLFGSDLQARSAAVIRAPVSHTHPPRPPMHPPSDP